MLKQSQLKICLNLNSHLVILINTIFPREQKSTLLCLYGREAVGCMGIPGNWRDAHMGLIAGNVQKKPWRYQSAYFGARLDPSHQAVDEQ